MQGVKVFFQVQVEKQFTVVDVISSFRNDYNPFPIPNFCPGVIGFFQIVAG